MSLGKRQIKLIIWFTIIALAMIVWTLRPNSSVTVISPIPETNSTSSVLSASLPTNLPAINTSGKNPESLRKRITEIIGGKWVNYSISIRDLNSDFTLETGVATIFDAASVNKLPILSALYYLVQKGELDLDRTITLQSKDIQDYGTGSIRYDKPGSTYSIQTLARLMIQKSDNTAAYVLSNHVIGLKKIQELVDSWGLTQTDITENKTSNQDMAFLLNKIYSGAITNPPLTQEMLGFLKDTDFEDRLPALLPSGVTIYHKIGTHTGVLHDVGIVVGPTTKYYIGVFTKDITDEAQTVEIIAKISQAVYEFMAK